MSMKISQAVQQVRSLVTGSLVDEVSVLAHPYEAATDTTLTLKYPKRALAVGSTICVGLNTFQVMATDASGTIIDVLPSMDGGPNEDAPQGTVVYIRPYLTTFAAFREISNEVQGISSRNTGLFAVWEYVVTALNRQSGTYPLDGLSPIGTRPFRLLRFEYRYAGTTTWQQSTDAEWQEFSNTLRVFQDPPGAIEYRFSLAVPFGQVLSLDQTFDDIGITDAQSNIPCLGAASTMALGWAGRRQQPFSQGDSRRSTEVPGGGIVQLSQQLRRAQLENLQDEVSRLQAAYTYRQPAVSGQSTYGRYGTYGGWR
jgi:hypothetical protein